MKLRKDQKMRAGLAGQWIIYSFIARYKESDYNIYYKITDCEAGEDSPVYNYDKQ